jgi:hypothetical protein
MGYLYQYIENNSVWKLNKSICYFFPFLQLKYLKLNIDYNGWWYVWVQLHLKDILVKWNKQP